MLFLVACEKKADWEITPETDNRIVVEGMITNEQKAHYVKLSLPFQALNQEPQTVSGAIVKISTDSVEWLLHETPAGSGIYLTDSNVQGVAGEHYYLSAKWQGRTITATAIMSPVTRLIPFRYIKSDNNQNLYKISWVCPVYNPDDAAMFSLDYDLQGSSVTHVQSWYYMLSTLDPGQILPPLQETIEFPAGTVIKERKYSLSDDHQKFLRELLLETRWRGGMFDMAAANVYTNLNGDAVGYFAACAVLECTTTIQ